MPRGMWILRGGKFFHRSRGVARLSFTAIEMKNGLMIDVANLTKRFAGHTAIADISFGVQAGEIVGFLGPNGAGKSTTMRILAGYLTASSGTARVAGFDVGRENREVRRRLGYMPENNPLHPEMRVREYLKFRGRLKGLQGRALRRRVDTVLDQCAIKDVRRRVIGQLSKGYRQRVGLADALLQEPPLIILDEPTIGLDPNQVRSVRQLIRSLAGRHTVLLSTHILYEVEMICSRVVIMHNGRLLASDTPENLRQMVQGGAPVMAEVAASQGELQEWLPGLPGFQGAEITPMDDPYYRCVITPQRDADIRPGFYQLARERGWKLRELTRNQHSLEDIFVHMTAAHQEEEEE